MKRKFTIYRNGIAQEAVSEDGELALDFLPFTNSMQVGILPSHTGGVGIMFSELTSNESQVTYLGHDVAKAKEMFYTIIDIRYGYVDWADPQVYEFESEDDFDA